MKKPTMLITGISGLLGNNLAYCLKERYDILGLYHDHPVEIKGIRTQRADLIDAKQVKKLIKEFAPQIVVHCAAISNVDAGEQDKALTSKVNIEATKNIVDCLRSRKAKLVYVSTDLVYGESNGRLLRESDPVSIINHYGQTKYQGELLALKKKGALVLRTNIFGWNIQKKASLAEWVVNELKNKRNIIGFKDAFFSGIYTFDFARALDQALQKNVSGIYNLGSREGMSKYDFAVRLAGLFNLDKKLIVPGSIDDVAFPAKRRKNLKLDVGKLEKRLKIKLPTMQETTQHFYEDYKKRITDEIRPGNYPKLDVIPYSRQSIDEDDIKAVVEVLKSSNLTQGPKVTEFEEKLCLATGAKFAIAVNSGTSALHIACLAAGVAKGDEVVTSTNSFVASANCALYCQARPVFADIDPRTYNISAQTIEPKVTAKTKALIPVHFAGQSCDMQPIRELIAKKEKQFGHKIHIIEDASHALGSLYQGKSVGSGEYSDMSVLSFHPVKHITTGEGGAVLTNDAQLARQLRRFRSHGITNAMEEFEYPDRATDEATKEYNPWYYEQQELGYNYRITDIQCALGISQLGKLSEFAKRRRQIVDIYNKTFGKMKDIQIPFEIALCRSNFHLYVALFDFKSLGISRRAVMNKLAEKNIRTQVHYIPIHTQPFYQKNVGTAWGDCPTAERYYQQCLSLPLYPEMSDQDQQLVIKTIKDIIS